MVKTVWERPIFNLDLQFGEKFGSEVARTLQIFISSLGRVIDMFRNMLQLLKLDYNKFLTVLPCQILLASHSGFKLIFTRLIRLCISRVKRGPNPLCINH